MADPEVQNRANADGDKAASGARRTVTVATGATKQAADAAGEAAKAGIEAEQRTFSAAQSSIKASQEMARQGQDMAKRATSQAADLWRSSLAPMSQFTGEFNRWVEQMWRGAASTAMPGGLPLAMLAPFTGQPLADMRETDRGFELNVDLPGMKSQNIELQLRGDMLIVSGEKAEQTDGGRGAYRFSERRFGRFERAFALPPGADSAKIEASFRDGVLKVEIPVSPEGERARTITVRS
jgi:HSP20 family protein